MSAFDGTLRDGDKKSMRGMNLLALGALGFAANGYGQVWLADFNTEGGFDGMTEFQNGNPDKDLFNPAGASGGILQVQTEDGVDFGGKHDKGGRLLGSSVSPATSSFSAYYKFAWSQMPEISTDTYTTAGFLG